MSDEMIVRQCAPTLAGIKTGSLFPCPYESRTQLMDEIRAMNHILVPKGLCMLPVRCEGGSALLYVYRPGRLQQDLQNDLAQRLLQKAGYSREAARCACPSWCSGCGGRRIFLTR